MEYSSKEIKALRNTLGMSQTEFGKALGVTKLTVINWELGKTGIKKESVREQIHELMEENNIANATDVFNGVEVVITDDKNKLSTVNCPYEVFEPKVFPSVFEKFLCNPDISEREKREAIRSIQRKILDYEDGAYITTSHIWPDQYIAQFHNAASDISSNSISLYSPETANEIDSLGINRSLIGEKTSNENNSSSNVRPEIKQYYDVLADTAARLKNLPSLSRIETQEELEKNYHIIDELMNMNDPSSLGTLQSIAASGSKTDNNGEAEA